MFRKKQKIPHFYRTESFNENTSLKFSLYTKCLVELEAVMLSLRSLYPDINLILSLSAVKIWKVCL